MRLEKDRLFKNMMRDPPPQSMYGKPADGFNPNPSGEHEIREDFANYRKQNPEEYTEDAGAKPVEIDHIKNKMSGTEAAKVLHLSEPTLEEITKRYSALLAANGEKGSSQYLMDKITHARDVSTWLFHRGSLEKYIKVKKPDERPTDTPPL